MTMNMTVSMSETQQWTPWDPMPLTMDPFPPRVTPHMTPIKMTTKQKVFYFWYDIDTVVCDFAIVFRLSLVDERLNVLLVVGRQARDGSDGGIHPISPWDWNCDHDYLRRRILTDLWHCSTCQKISTCQKDSTWHCSTCQKYRVKDPSFFNKPRAFIQKASRARRTRVS